MKLIWTKNHQPLSVLIRHLFKEPCSHFAVVLDDQIVFHSNMSGAHIEWYPSFKKNQTIVFEIEVEENGDEVYNALLGRYHELLDKYDGKPYDFGGLLYGFWRAILWRFFNKPIPTTNAWAKADAFMCVELFVGLPLKNPPQLPRDIAMVSPYQIYLALTK
jgi:hypothetical protein